MQVFKDGKLLFVRDKDALDKIKIWTIKEYLDFKPVINKFCKETLGCTI